MNLDFSGYYKNILLLSKTSLNEFSIMIMLNGEEKMNSRVQPTILVVGHNTTLSYLLGRFAERSGYQLINGPENLSVEEIAAASPIVIIFPSTELLVTTQALVRKLASLDTPIMVCSSVADEARTRELGADYCLLHPLTYDDFQAALMYVGALKRT